MSARSEGTIRTGLGAELTLRPGLDRDYVDRLSTQDPRTPFGLMRFRLTYSGDLPPASRENRQLAAKWAIRSYLHPQLKDLYVQEHILSGDPSFLVFTGGPSAQPTESPNDSRMVGEYQFIPLARKSLSMACDLDITFLRPGEEGSVIAKGDLDNRLKTLFDGLRMPEDSDMRLAAGIEQPMYCLMDDDKLVTSLTVRTDRLLAPPSAAEYYSLLLIDVTLRILKVTPSNYRFVGIW